MRLSGKKWSCLISVAAILLLGSVPRAARGQPEKVAQTGAGGLTLSAAVSRALQFNPMMAAASSGREIAGARLNEAESGRLPMLQFQEQYTNSNNPVFVFGSLLEQSRFGMPNFALDYLNNPPSLSNFRSSLNLRIPVFNRNQVSSGIEQAHLGESRAEEDLEWTAQQIRFQTIQAYYGVLVAEGGREVADEAVKSAEAELYRMKNLQEQGMIVLSDVLAMEVQLADFRQQQVRAAGEVQTARAALNTVLALPVDTPQQIAGALGERAFQVPTQEELISRALASRPDSRQATLDVEIAEQQLRAIKGNYYPDLNVFAQYGFSSQTLANGSGDYAVGASLNFDLMDFGRSPRIQQAVGGLSAAKAREAQKNNEVKLEVVRALQNFLTAQERVQMASVAEKQAIEALRIVEDRHATGLTTTTEVLRAQTALLSTRMNLLAARYELYLGYAQTLLVTGSLKDAAAFGD